MDFEKIADILEEELGVERADIKPESKLKDDLEADSIDLFNLIMKLEDESGVKIAEEDYPKLVTVQDIQNYIAAAK